MRGIFRSLAVCCSLLVVACNDVTGAASPRDLDITVPSLNTALESRVTDEWVEPPPLPEGESPPDSLAEANLITYRTEAGFERGYAYGQAYMKYFGSVGEQAITLRLRNSDGAEVTSRTATDRQRSWFPWTREIWSGVTVMVHTSCGLLADAATTHLAAHDGIVPGTSVRFTQEEAGSDRSASQPACPPKAPSGGGGGATNGVEVCQWIEWYDEATGEYQGRELIGCYILEVDNA